MKNAWLLLAAVCALVIGVYTYLSQSGLLELLNSNPASTYYNLLVQGFRAGHLSLEKDVPPGLAQLDDPYDPAANAPYRGLPYQLHDLSYYKGRLYLYFGVTPALILFWPYVALTGHYLFHRQAVTLFCSIGFLASVSLLSALWRRYFAEVSVGVVTTCALALGLATGLPVLLSQGDVYQVPISCGYMLMMLMLGAIWCAWHDPQRRYRWLVVASVSCGLAMGARPLLLFAAVILLGPVAQEWRERRKIWAPLLAATGPILLIGLGLMLYNARRFGSPFEFGVRYQLAAYRVVTTKLFNLQYLRFNFWLYFLQPARWIGHFPFVQVTTLSRLPAGYVLTESPFGVLTNIPLVWLALATPLAWRDQTQKARTILRGFLASVALLFGAAVLPLLFFNSAIIRYEVDFVPALVLLAVVGIFGLERTLADRPAWRRAVRWAWGLLLCFSVVFNLLASIEYHAVAHHVMGVQLFQAGNVPEAIKEYELALRLNPDYAKAHLNLGIALEQTGRTPEAIEQYQRVLRLHPDYTKALLDLGIKLEQRGQLPEAIQQYEQALRLDPDYVKTRRTEGIALEQTVRLHEAIERYQQALRIKPDDAEVHNNLGADLAQAGREPEAIGHFDEAVRLRPDYAEAHFNLAVALEHAGKVPDAIQHYQQALRINPALTDARSALARLQAGQ
jgi:tetratricopeptide (TPR) repeat protein